MRAARARRRRRDGLRRGRVATSSRSCARTRDAAERDARRQPARGGAPARRREGRRARWRAATSSRPTTSPGWPARCSGTGSCCAPRPSSSATTPPTRCARRCESVRRAAVTATREPDAARRRRARPRSRCSRSSLGPAARGDAGRRAGRRAHRRRAASRRPPAARAAARAVDRRPRRARDAGDRADRRGGRAPRPRAPGAHRAGDRARAAGGRRRAGRRARRAPPRALRAAAGVRCASPARSAWRPGTTRAGEAHELLVYPDLPAARRLALAVRPGRFRESGERSRGPLGLGTEFESIRDYLPDDDIRQVNWPATVRMGRPMSNQYRVEQDRDVICVLDCGRLMAAPLERRRDPAGHRDRRGDRGRARRRRARRPLRHGRLRRHRPPPPHAAPARRRRARAGGLRPAAGAGRLRLRAGVRHDRRRPSARS